MPKLNTQKHYNIETMKHIFFTLAVILSAGVGVTSCSDEEVINVESPVTRDYQTDSQILSKFVDFNSSTGEYFINENKRPNAISYLNDKDWLELQKINPINYTRYEKELQELNRQLAEYEKDPNISRIVYSTYDGKTYVKDLNNDNSIQIERSFTISRSTKAYFSQMSISNGTQSYASFNTGSTIHTDIQILAFGYYLCELKCNTKGAHCTNNNLSSLVLSGTGPTGTVSYTWTNSSSSTFWNFTGIGKSFQFGQIIQIDFVDD